MQRNRRVGSLVGVVVIAAATTMASAVDLQECRNAIEGLPQALARLDDADSCGAPRDAAAVKACLSELSGVLALVADLSECGDSDSRELKGRKLRTAAAPPEADRELLQRETGRYGALRSRELQLAERLEAADDGYFRPEDWMEVVRELQITTYEREFTERQLVCAALRCNGTGRLIRDRVTLLVLIERFSVGPPVIWAPVVDLVEAMARYSSELPAARADARIVEALVANARIRNPSSEILRTTARTSWRFAARDRLLAEGMGSLAREAVRSGLLEQSQRVLDESKVRTFILRIATRLGSEGVLDQASIEGFVRGESSAFARDLGWNATGSQMRELRRVTANTLRSFVIR